jgi:hypothetical protein
MSEHQRETAFLRHLIAFDNTDESRKLGERILEGERNERCIIRVASLAGVFLALGLAGFAYGVFLDENFPHGETPIGLRLLCEVGLASVIPLAVLVGLFLVYRMKFDRLREECRLQIAQFLESRLRALAAATPGLAGNTENNGSANRNDFRELKAAIEVTDFSRFEGEGGREGPIPNLVGVTPSGEDPRQPTPQLDQP